MRRFLLWSEDVSAFLPGAMLPMLNWARTGAHHVNWSDVDVIYYLEHVSKSQRVMPSQCGQQIPSDARVPPGSSYVQMCLKAGGWAIFLEATSGNLLRNIKVACYSSARKRLMWEQTYNVKMKRTQANFSCNCTTDVTNLYRNMAAETDIGACMLSLMVLSTWLQNKMRDI